MSPAHSRAQGSNACSNQPHAHAHAHAHAQPHKTTQIQETATTLSITARPLAIPLSRYVEPFSKAGGQTHWGMRRDVRLGRSMGELFYTTCGTLIFRVYARGLLFDEPIFVSEDYIRLEDGGRAIMTRQCCMHAPSGRTAEQKLAGTYHGPEPPPGHA